MDFAIDRVILAMVALGAMLGLSLAQAAPSAAVFPFESRPMPGQCYPIDPASKKYLQEKRSFGTVWKKFTCDFACLGPDGSAEIVTGTQTDWYFGGDDGTHFVCAGYTMEFIETPMNRTRLGYMTIKAIKPFDANLTKIKELKLWHTERFPGAGFRPTQAAPTFSFPLIM
jgi:hypothetical protein